MLDLSNSPLKLGLTVDLNNYGINPERGEYVKWFSEETNGEGPKILHVYTIDSHVHKDKGIYIRDDKERFEENIGNFADFIKTKFPQVDLISFQFLYNQLSIELEAIFELDNIYGSSDKNVQRDFLLNQGKILDIENAHEMLLSYLDILSESDFSSLKYPPMVVLHAGGIMPNDLAKDYHNLNLFREIRRKLRINQIEYHNTLFNYIKKKNVLISLENIPAWDSIVSRDVQGNKISIENQWLSEHAFEDLEDRLKIGGGHTIDLAHSAMNIGYFNQDSLKIESLEMIKNEFEGIPDSLTSIEQYIKKASQLLDSKEYPKIIYHLCDCNGLSSENEGVAIGSENSFINWQDVINIIRTYTPSSYGALEIQGGHLKENYESKIIKSLQNFLDYCK